jgi:site-specific DNA recombinase
MLRFAFYGRLSTEDRQDWTLARPSQLAGCQAKARELGGEVTVEFFDVMGGARDDRQQWSELIAEARCSDRRFDAVVMYQTRCLSRDRVSAGLFERELKRLKHPVAVHYVFGGDSSTSEGELMVAVGQAIDEFERSRLKRETRRGQRQNTLNGYRSGGRAPYGYRNEAEPHPVEMRARRGDTKSRLVPDPECMLVVVRIFRMWAEEGLGLTAICDRLNAEGIPNPGHTDTRRNIRGTWSGNTLKALLQNPTYLGRLCWDRTDHSVKRERGGGSPRKREESEWVYSEVKHPAIISQELFDDAQARFRSKERPQGRTRKNQRVYLLSGFVKCASGHAPLAMFGRQRFAHTYACCSYGREYGKEAAEQIGHPAWMNVREDTIVALLEGFFSERVFGETRMEKLVAQLDAPPRSSPNGRARQRLTKQLADLDGAIAAQVRGLEAGVEPQVVQARIEELKAECAPHVAALSALPPDMPTDYAKLATCLAAIPDLREPLRDAPLESKRAIYSTFGLQVMVDKLAGTAQISAIVDETTVLACIDSSVLRTGPNGGGPTRPSVQIRMIETFALV